MKTRRGKKQIVMSPSLFYRSYICRSCRKNSKNALVLWEQYVNDNCVLIKIECPKCGEKEAPLIYKDEYTNNIVGGKYFKNTP